MGKHLELAHPPGNQVWEINLGTRSLAFLNDHQVEGEAILPGTAYLEMVQAAAAQAFGGGGHVLSDVEFHKALFMVQGAAPIVQLIFSPNSSGEISYQAYGRPAGAEASSESWLLYSSGTVLREQSDSLTPNSEVEIEEIRARCRDEISGDDFYQDFSERGNQWGPNFQCVRRLWMGDGEVLAELQVPQPLEPEIGLYQFHPAVLDACCQVLAAVPATETADQNQAGPIVFKSANRLQVYRGPGLRLWSHARLRLNVELSANTIAGDIRVFDETGHLIAELNGINLQYLEPGARHSVPEKLDDWFYELRWEPKARAGTAITTAPSSGGRKWLIFADIGGVGRDVESHLKERGESCVIVSPGKVYRKSGPDHYEVNPAHPEDFQRLLADACEPGDLPCCGIVHLWSLDAAPAEETTTASLEDAQLLGSVSVLHLTQSLVKHGLAGWAAPPRLWLVTTGAQQIEGKSAKLSPAQSPLWGLGRVIFHEHPEFRGRMIDLGTGAAQEIQELCQEFFTDDGEDQLALRGSQRYVARLVRHVKTEVALSGIPELDANGAYLITGGLGDLGLVVARWMAERGAGRLILMGRTKLPPRTEWDHVEKGSRLAAQVAAVRELEATGTEVHLAAADVTDETQLRSVLETVRLKGWPPIRGVVHAAGTVQFQTAFDTNASEMADVLRPKVIGGWLLHRLFEDAPLDFFILFSSAAAFLSSPLLGSYAAANVFLDALAHYRFGRGQTALSINWGFWDEVGIAVRYLEGSGGKLRPRGMGSFTPAQALAAFELLLSHTSPQVAVMPISWPQWSRFYPSSSQSPMLSHLVSKEVHAPTKASATKGRRGFIKDRLAEVDDGERQQLLATYLTEQVAQVLRLPASRLSRQQPLNKLGLDSLMAVELKNRIEIETGVVVPVVKFLRGPSIDQLATLILDQLEQSAVASLVAPVKAVIVNDWEEGRL